MDLSVSDHYRTLAAPAESRIKIERSEFLGMAFPVTNDDDFFAALARIEKERFDATHHCWAFRLFAGGDVRARSSDAGEPSGTAGKPILSAIEAAGLFDVAVVVVRWFGGVKLGTGGLSRAYREGAAATLRDARLADRFVYARLRVEVPFASLSALYRLVSPPDVVLAGEAFDATNVFDLDVRQSRVAEVERSLAERRLIILP